MIIVKFYSTQDFVVQDYSNAFAKDLANLLECKEDELILINVKSNSYFKGFEENNWYVLIELTLDPKYHELQDNINKFIVKSFGDHAISSTIVFNYVESHHIVNNQNDKYPKFLSKTNTVKVENPNYNDEDLKDEEKIFTGDAFKNIK